jgi:RimJ/RimL family protein N-acetyltransferase
LFEGELMELQDLSLDDLSLYESFHCDPRMMAYLGGPWPRERLPEKLKRDVATIEAGTGWIFKIISGEDSKRAVGSVCIWKHAWRDESINEIGWMILPPYQGRGLATEAVRAILDKARSEKRWGTLLHAFPAVANIASNAICRKMNFSLVEEVDLEYAGHPLRCNHWRLNL